MLLIFSTVIPSFNGFFCKERSYNVDYEKFNPLSGDSLKEIDLCYSTALVTKS